MKMHNPPHPGEILRDGVLASGEITVSDFARRLGVSRVALSRVVNGRAAVSAEMAARLAAALGGSAESWLHLQANYELWHVRRTLGRTLSRIAPLQQLAQSVP